MSQGYQNQLPKFTVLDFIENNQELLHKVSLFTIQILYSGQNISDSSLFLSFFHTPILQQILSILPSKYIQSLISCLHCSPGPYHCSPRLSQFFPMDLPTSILGPREPSFKTADKVRLLKGKSDHFPPGLKPPSGFCSHQDLKRPEQSGSCYLADLISSYSHPQSPHSTDTDLLVVTQMRLAHTSPRPVPSLFSVAETLSLQPSVWLVLPSVTSFRCLSNCNPQ